jgi:ATP/maltotriose-dependent transcriptional regulator MalT
MAAYLGETLYAQERDDEAIRLTEVSESMAAADDLTSQIVWRATRAKARARSGDDGGAEVLAREAVSLAEETDCLVLHADALMSLAEVLFSRGAAVEAAARLSEALALYEAKGNVVSAAAARDRLEDATVTAPSSPGEQAS